MKKLYLFVLILLSVSVRAQHTFTIKGYSLSFKKGDKVFLAYKENSNFIYDSTIVANGHFVFRGKATGKVVGTLYHNENPQFATEVHDSRDVYLEPGTITLTTRDSLQNARVTGTRDNVELSQLNNLLQPLRTEYGQVSDHLDSLDPHQKERIALLRIQLNDIDKKIAAAQIIFIKSHPYSYISLVTVQGLLKTQAFLQATVKAFYDMSLKARHSALGSNCRQILLPMKGRQLVLRRLILCSQMLMVNL